MKFPKWVAPSKTSKTQVASNRLRYLLGRLALEFSAEGTLKALCRKVGVSHSTISIYIRNGHFSPVMALKFEKAFGAERAAAMWLQDPSSIPQSAE